MLRLLITIMGLGLVVHRGMVDWGISRGMVDSMVNRGMVDSMMSWSMVDSMVCNCWGSMDCMMDSRGCMMNGVSTKGCEWNSRPSSHERDKSN